MLLGRDEVIQDILPHLRIDALVGTPRGQQLPGGALRTTGKKLVAQLHEAFDALDEDFPELVAGYHQARRRGPYPPGVG